MTIDIFHTLENRYNADEVERDGPFICNDTDSWLGDGYYFWETFIENAHWWGQERLRCPDGYMICQAECDFTDDLCFDLVGNTKHLLQFEKIFELLKRNGLADQNTTVKRILYYLQDKTTSFNFQAVRAHGFRSKSFTSKFSKHLFFTKKRFQYLDMKPTIQICLYNKRALGLRNFHIIYPDEYIAGYST